MGISHRSSAESSNPAAAATFLAIAKPTIQDGDFLVVAIGIPGGSAVTITPPSGWTLVRRVNNDGAKVISIAVYYKFAASEPANWVWSFSASARYTGGVSAYSGVDHFVPLDDESGYTIASSATHTIPAVTSSGEGDWLVASYAASTTGTYTAPTGYTERFDNTQTTSTCSGSDKILGTIGQVVASSATFSAAEGGATHLMLLRPSVGQSTIDEVRESLIALLPPGATELYDLETTSTDSTYYFLQALADAVKYYGFDYVDAIRQEFQPARSIMKLPDWESALGISQAQHSTGIRPTYASRQQAVVSKWREHGATTKTNIRSIIEPLLDFAAADRGTLQVIETDRSLLGGVTTGLHNYAFTAGAIPGAGNANFTAIVSDDAPVSDAGAQIAVSITHAHFEQLSFTLTGPTHGTNTLQTGTISLSSDTPTVTGTGTRFQYALKPGMQITIDQAAFYTIAEVVSDTVATLTTVGTTSSGAYYTRLRTASKTWAAGYLGTGSSGLTGVSYLRLYAKECAGCCVLGTWTLNIAATIDAGSLDEGLLFVEGCGRDSAGNNGLGGSQFTYAVFADSTKCGPNADYGAAQKALDRLNPAYAQGRLTFDSTAVAAGTVGMIPSDISARPGSAIPHA